MKLFNLAEENEPLFHLVNMDHMVVAKWYTPFDGGPPVLQLEMTNGETVRVPDEKTDSVVLFLEGQGWML